MIQLTDNVFAAVLPEGATDVGIIADCLVCKLPGSKANSHKWLLDATSFMRKKGGQWEFICTSKDATEEEARKIVQKEEGYDAYKEYEKDGPWVNEKATASLTSLLKSKGLEGNYALIRKL